MWIIIGLIISYFIGSIPTAYIFGRVLKGIDIRKFGSGNVGATNALRVLGKGPGVLVLLIDIVKGLIVTVFVADFIIGRPGFTLTAEATRLLLGFVCVCGHNWTVFLRLKGGKGVATTLGVLLGLALKLTGFSIVMLLVVMTWFVMFFALRIVSLASVVSGISLPVYTFCFRQSPPLFYASIFIAILVILRHKSNIQRILHGKESRLSFKKSPK